MPQLDPFIFFDEALTAAVFLLVFYRYFLFWFVPLVLRARLSVWLLNGRALARVVFVARRVAASLVPLSVPRPDPLCIDGAGGLGALL